MLVSDCVCVTLASHSVNELISSAEVFGTERWKAKESKTIKSFFQTARCAIGDGLNESSKSEADHHYSYFMHLIICI